MKKINNAVKYGLYILLSAFLIGCGETHIHEIVNRTKTIEIQTEVLVKKINGNGKYEIIIIDGCEYIEHHYHGNSGVGIGIVHKGNCENH